MSRKTWIKMLDKLLAKKEKMLDKSGNVDVLPTAEKTRTITRICIWRNTSIE